jgi:PPM family protein phosphatase
MIAMRVAGLSDIGSMRDKNEDAFWYDAPRGIFVLAAGVGSDESGQVAAGMAIEIASAQIVHAVGSGWKEERLSDALQDTFFEASRVIHETATKDAALQGMACSLIVAVVSDGFCYLGHVGNTRAYLFFDKSLCQMTIDDTPVAGLVKRGYLLPEKSRTHIWANILLKTVGGQPRVDANLLRFPVKKQERLLFCSDGLWSMLEQSAMEQLFSSQPDPQTVCLELVQTARSKGGKDNITAVVAEVEDQADLPISEPSAELRRPFLQ